MTSEQFTLELPRDPAFVATARMFASSLARHFEIEEDVVEDLKLAVSEACTRAIAAANRKDEPLAVSVARDNGRLVFEVSQGDPSKVAETGAQEQLSAGLSLELITALFADAEVAADAGGQPVVRFSIP
ncbi:MAG: ATP-binding protein [Actinomycetota bacterium]